MKKLWILGYAKCAQGRFRSDCTNAQADLNLHRAHMFEGMFSDIGAHVFLWRSKKIHQYCIYPEHSDTLTPYPTGTCAKICITHLIYLSMCVKSAG